MSDKPSILVAQVFEWAMSIENDATQSQVGPSADELREVGRILALLERMVLAAGKVEPLKQNTSTERLEEVRALVKEHFPKDDAPKGLIISIWRLLGRHENMGFDECLSYFIPKTEAPLNEAAVRTLEAQHDGA